MHTNRSFQLNKIWKFGHCVRNGHFTFFVKKEITFSRMTYPVLHVYWYSSPLLYLVLFSEDESSTWWSIRLGKLHWISKSQRFLKLFIINQNTDLMCPRGHKVPGQGRAGCRGVG